MEAHGRGRPRRDEPGRPTAVRGARRPVTAGPHGVGSLFDLDPELGQSLSERQRLIGDKIGRVEVRSLPRGPWHPRADPVSERAGYGLLLVDGALSRRAKVVNRYSVELLGATDLLCPDVPDADHYAQVPQTATWQVLVESRVIVLGEEFVAGLAGLPGVLGKLQRRSIARSRELAARLALLGEPKLALRLELILWHLADRWGVRRSGVVVLALPLTGALIADLASANRSATGRALGELEGRGVVRRQANGSLALLGSPPELDAPTS